MGPRSTQSCEQRLARLPNRTSKTSGRARNKGAKWSVARTEDPRHCRGSCRSSAAIVRSRSKVCQRGQPSVQRNTPGPDPLLQPKGQNTPPETQSSAGRSHSFGGQVAKPGSKHHHVDDREYPSSIRRHCKPMQCRSYVHHMYLRSPIYCYK